MPRLRRKIVLLGSVTVLAGVSALLAPVGAAQLSDETIAARQHYFGLDNVNAKTGAVRRDRVILSWTGVSSFAAAFRGHVVFLDGWIPRGGTRPSVEYIGSTPEELAALKPELYLFGHAHTDHAGDLPTIIRANPDVLVAGAAEHCNDIEGEVTDVEFDCLRVFEEGAEFGALREFRNLIPGVGVPAVNQGHSRGPTDHPEEGTPFTKEGECFAPIQYPSDPDVDRGWAAPTSGSIALAWQFRIGNFALIWQDTAGPFREDRAAVAEAFASLPPTDVRLASVVVSGRNVLNEHNEVLRPKLFIPLHGDPCFFLLRQQVEEQLATIPEDSRPEMWFISDPGDYLRPISFDPSAKAWRDRGRLDELADFDD